MNTIEYMEWREVFNLPEEYTSKVAAPIYSSSEHICLVNEVCFKRILSIVAIHVRNIIFILLAAENCGN